MRLVRRRAWRCARCRHSLVCAWESIDEILSGLTANLPASTPFKSGAAQYIGDTQIAPAPAYTPAQFDLTEYQLKYANQMIAQGVPAQRAIEEAGLGEKIGSMAGGWYGNTQIPIIGGMIGSTLGGAVGSIVDDIFDW